MRRAAIILASLVLAAAAGDHIVGGFKIFGQPTWDDHLVPIALAGRAGNTDPDWKVFKNGVYQLAFDGGGTRDEEVFGALQMPHRWLEGDSIVCHIHHSPETADAGNVRWCHEITLASIDGTFGATTTTCADCAVTGTAFGHYLCTIETVTMTGHTISTVGPLRIYRNGTHANDTYNGNDVFGLYYDCHYRSDSHGSHLETSK